MLQWQLVFVILGIAATISEKSIIYVVFVSYLFSFLLIFSLITNREVICINIYSKLAHVGKLPKSAVPKLWVKFLVGHKTNKAD